MRRLTAITTDALTPAFTADWQWRAFTDMAAIDPGPLAPVLEELSAFPVPHTHLAEELNP
ncbi:hypothetical protein [Hoeflea sp.]|uniref:hypothetical protein n=1 Tax=Hoeflea sp. TaxID=1940281 RepID=UPI003B0171A3